eukprot:1432377-Amphidinium_carterae.1
MFESQLCLVNHVLLERLIRGKVQRFPCLELAATRKGRLYSSESSVCAGTQHMCHHDDVSGCIATDIPFQCLDVLHANDSSLIG